MREKPILYIGNIKTDVIIIEDDSEFEYVGIARNNIIPLQCYKEKEVTNDLILRRLNKIIENNHIQIAKDFLNKRKDIGTLI